MTRIAWLALPALLAAGAAPAQENGFVACASQEAIEQYIGAGGEAMPDGCQIVGMAVAESEAGLLCAIDIGEAQEGLIGAIQDAAVPSQWWASCQAVAAQLP